MRLHIDRSEQIEIIDGLLQEHGTTARLALIVAPAEMGKTALAEEIIGRYDGRLPTALVHLGDAPHAEHLLVKIAAELGSPFPEFDRRRRSDRVPGDREHPSRLSGVTTDRLRGTAAMRQRRDNDLLSAFVDDLSAVAGPKKLIVVDGIGDIEQADDPYTRWLTDAFVFGMLGVPDLVLVLAGRSRPNISFATDRGAVPVRLGPLGLDHVAEWIRAEARRGLAPSDGLAELSKLAELSRRMWSETAGIPGQIAARLRTELRTR